ncbi:MAG: PLP-dependent aminotransferase family protein [Acidobacteriota bacterium]
MAKAETFQDLSLAPPRDGQELWRWLYTALRAAILDGRLKPGTRLPSTRSLAKQYGLSRGTVSTAFDQLHSEGYTQTEVGAGTFVALELPDVSMTARRLGRVHQPLRPTSGLSKGAKKMIEGVRPLPASRSLGKAFRTHEPAIDLFPVNLWARVAGRVLRRSPRSLYGQGDAGGYRPLRKAIAEYLGASRGVHCDAGQILITSGSQQGLDLVARIFLDPGDRVWIEDPCYPGARFALRATGARLIPVPVDQQGLNVGTARKLAPHARMAYVTPANQFPLGVTMSLERRLSLLDWAASHHALIIEDDYDAEYRYLGPPVAALQSLDRSGCVLYIGTFTKLLFNALRLGFLVVPERFVQAFEAARTFIDRHAPTLDQAILAEFILEGYFGHHVRRMRRTYAERLSQLEEAAREHLGGLMDVTHATAGMRTIGWLKTASSDTAVAARARSLGLELSALSSFTTRHSHPPALVLGFAGCGGSELRRGVRVLAAVLQGDSNTDAIVSGS